MGRVTKIVRPLSPITYFRRNLGRTLPLGFVIVLSVFLIASIVIIVNSIDLTGMTIYNYTRYLTVIIPRAGQLHVSDKTVDEIEKLTNHGRVIEASGFFFNVNTVVGRLPFVCLGVSNDDRDFLLKRVRCKLAEGRMPKSGEAEAVVSEGIVRNRRIKIGDMLSSPTETSGVVTPSVPVKLVGILKGDTWIAITSQEFVDNALPFVPHSILATTRYTDEQIKFGDVLEKRMDKRYALVFSYHSLIKELRTSLSAMYLIMALVNGTVIFVVVLMSGMLSNIYFTQRVSEFAILSAIGIRRLSLIGHAVTETAILNTVGWILGVGITWLLMSFLKGNVFEPRGMLINPLDLYAYAYTIPIPVCITLFAIFTIGRRLVQMDPVTVIERR